MVEELNIILCRTLNYKFKIIIYYSIIQQVFSVSKNTTHLSNNNNDNDYYDPRSHIRFENKPYIFALCVCVDLREKNTYT